MTVSLRDSQPRSHVLLCLAAVIWALAACGSSDADVASTDHTTAESATSAGPAPGDSSVELVPGGLNLVREYETPEPGGGTAHLRWFAPNGSTSPVLTVNVTVDVDANARLDRTESLAAEFGDAAQREGIESPPFERTTVRDADAIVYSDPLGWRTVTWAPRGDVLVAVNGLRFSTGDLMRVAEQVQVP